MNSEGVNSFREDLAFSDWASDQPFWLDVYKQAWPNLIACVRIVEDGWCQRSGVDRKIITAAGQEYKVDEKARRSVYPDILVEYTSNTQRNTPGWIEKPLDCDFIAYAFIPSRECYLLPLTHFQRAWRDHKAEWLRRYKFREAKNHGYATRSCPVPISVLLQSINSAMVFNWQADAPDPVEEGEPVSVTPISELLLDYCLQQKGDRTGRAYFEFRYARLPIERQIAEAATLGLIS